MAGKSSSKKDKESKEIPKNEGSAGKKRGWDEIESLFDDKKKKKAEEAMAAKKAESFTKKTNQETKTERIEKPKTNRSGGDWVDDGLGGVYNSEGFTGRVEDGIKIFKAHVIQQSPNAGQTDLCPFDCKCCYM